jgi:hypothetical protein
MSLIGSRLGLSFEVAPPAASHPLRTDIACLVGTVARRRQAVPPDPQALPSVLRRWLQSHHIERVGGVPLAQLRVALASVPHFIDSVLTLTGASSLAAQGDSEREALGGFFSSQLATPSATLEFSDLLRACRELTPLTDALLDDLRERGLSPSALSQSQQFAAWSRVQRLHNLPIALESFAAFEALFAWEQRGIRDRLLGVGDAVVATPLGVALRAFFGEGGRRAYVVRTGDPSHLFDTATDRFAACFAQDAGASDVSRFDTETDRCPQLPGIRRSVRRDVLAGLTETGRPVAMSTTDWVGLEHVYGLTDVSFALLPDLIDACAQALPSELPPAQQLAVAERFADCVDEAPAVNPSPGRRLPPPRLNSLGLEVWRQLVGSALRLLDNPGRAFHRRDVQLLTSLPLLGDGRDLPAPAQWLAWMAQAPGWMSPAVDGSAALLSERLQLAYPWLRTADSSDSQGGVEASEGTLAGVLALSALERGSYRSAASRPLARYQDSLPSLAWSQTTQQTVWTPLGDMTLAERVCLLGPSPAGPQLLSDVSCSADANTRQASVRRLINVVVQAARTAGDEFAFQVNGERLWMRVRERLSDLMRVLLTAGALSSDGLPFVVRCGRDTMHQNDLDAGRLIAHIELQPAQPIARIVVVLNLRDAGSMPALAQAA